MPLLGGEPAASLQFELLLSNPLGAQLQDARAVATISALAMIEDSPFDPNWGDVGAFSAASGCTQCHRASDAAPGVMTHAGEDVSPGAGWAHSLMAHAVSDRYFQPAVVEETTELPEFAAAIEDSCLTCHAPMGRTHAHQTGQFLDDQGYYRLETALAQMHAREGVSCTARHQIRDDGSLGTALSFSGQYAKSNTQYTPAFGAHTTASAICATCHTLITPSFDVRTGQPTGRSFAEQTPYLEGSSTFRVEIELLPCPSVRRDSGMGKRRG